MFPHRKETTAPSNLGVLDVRFGQFFLEQFGRAAETCLLRCGMPFGLSVRNPERDRFASGFVIPFRPFA